MPKYLVTIQPPDPFDPSSMTEAVGCPGENGARAQFSERRLVGGSRPDPDSVRLCFGTVRKGTT
jgi:hypothetical protein